MYLRHFGNSLDPFFLLLYIIIYLDLSQKAFDNAIAAVVVVFNPEEEACSPTLAEQVYGVQTPVYRLFLFPDCEIPHSKYITICVSICLKRDLFCEI